VLAIRRKLLDLARTWKPTVAVLIDLPDFNLSLCRTLKKLGIPVIYYVSPQVWAWRRSRLKTIARYVEHMLVLFKFEQELYRAQGIPCTWVGHPAVDRLPLQLTGQVDPHQLALLPGSRPSEVRRHLPIMLETVARLQQRIPGLRAVILQAPGLDPMLFQSVTKDEHLDSRASVQVCSSQQLDMLASSQAVLTASGTATLEAALLGRPMVVLYRVSTLTWWLARALVRGVRHISLVNILLKQAVVPEFLQRFSADDLADAMEPLLTDPAAVAAQQAAFSGLFAEVGQGEASRRAAEVVHSFLLREP
jgi:lipid-A-disaccharide synthase